MRLPPYSKSIDQSLDTVWLWAGEKNRVHQTVKTFAKNTIVFYAPNNPKEYVWFVKNRKVALVHFFEPENFWVKQIILALSKAGSSFIAEVSWPGATCWWNPHYNLYKQYFSVYGDDPIKVNHYLRS